MISPSIDLAQFITRQTEIASPSILPELKIYMASEVTPLWQLTEERLKQDGLPPPYWAFAWPGGQGVARYILDHPESVRGKRIIDFAAGSGIAAIAAMKAGAAQATATEIDPLALKAIELNAALNEVRIEMTGDIDMTQPPKDTDLILAGDVCYQQAMAARLTRWLWICVANGIRVLLADPGRAYVPLGGLDRELACYEVPTSRDLEDRDSRTVKLWDLQVPKFDDPD